MAIAVVDGRRWCCRRLGGVGGCLNWRWWMNFLVMFPVCWTGRVCGTVGGLALGVGYPDVVAFLGHGPSLNLGRMYTMWYFPLEPITPLTATFFNGPHITLLSHSPF